MQYLILLSHLFLPSASLFLTLYISIKYIVKGPLFQIGPKTHKIWLTDAGKEVKPYWITLTLFLTLIVILHICGVYNE